MAYWAAVARGSRRRKWEPLKFIERNFICSVNNVKSGRWWVVLTSSFAHFNPLHLIVNTSALWDIGRMFVHLFGTPAFVGTWLVSAITGSLATLYWQRYQNWENMPTIGGSLGSSGAPFELVFARRTSLPYTMFRTWIFCAFMSGTSV